MDGPATPGREPSRPLRLPVAGGGAAFVRPLLGEDEIALDEAASGPDGLPPAALAALVLARAVRLEGADGRAADLPLGTCNRLLLAAFLATYAAPPALLARCEGCGERLEVPLDLAAFLGEDPVEPARVHALQVRAGGGIVSLRFRLPGASDVAAAVAAAPDDPAAARRLLLARLVRPAEAVADEAVADAVEAAMEEADPLAEIRMSAPCPVCGAVVAALLDPLALLLGEIDRRGGILLEVDRIARAYRWSEREILSLSPRRRRHYLALISAGGAGTGGGGR